MKISELIKTLTDLMQREGDLNVAVACPEGDYTRLEGSPDIVEVGYRDSSDGDFLDYGDVIERMKDDGEINEEDLLPPDETVNAYCARVKIAGPFICIGIREA